MNREKAARKRRSAPGRRCRQSGQSYVELAIAVTVLPLLLLIACDFARMFYSQITVNDAARAGAQFGAQSLVTAANTAGIKSAVTNDASNITLSSGSPTVSQCTCISTSTSVPVCSSAYPCSDNPGATYVTVTVSTKFSTYGSYPGLANPVTLTGTAEMEVMQ